MIINLNLKQCNLWQTFKDDHHSQEIRNNLLFSLTPLHLSTIVTHR